MTHTQDYYKGALTKKRWAPLTKHPSPRARFIRHTQAIDVCLASWPIDPETIYEFTMTPPVIPQTEETP